MYFFPSVFFALNLGFFFLSRAEMSPKHALITIYRSQFKIQSSQPQHLHPNDIRLEKDASDFEFKTVFFPSSLHCVSIFHFR